MGGESPSGPGRSTPGLGNGRNDGSEAARIVDVNVALKTARLARTLRAEPGPVGCSGRGVLLRRPLVQFSTPGHQGGGGRRFWAHIGSLDGVTCPAISCPHCICPLWVFSRESHSPSPWPFRNGKTVSPRGIPVLPSMAADRETLPGVAVAGGEVGVDPELAPGFTPHF